MLCFKVINLVFVSMVLLPLASFAEAPLVEVDASCKAELKKADNDMRQANMADNGASSAARNAAIKSCLDKSLSKDCTSQFKVRNYSNIDEVCRKQFQQASASCVQPNMKESQEKFLSSLSPKCQEQLLTYRDRSLKMAKACYEFMEKVCNKNSPANEQMSCRKQHQAEINDVCTGNKNTQVIK